MGPIHSQAESITRMLRAGQSVVHVVTLLEEMPVQETARTRSPSSEARFGLGAVVVNQVREPLVDEALLEIAAASRTRRGRVRDDLAEVGVRPTARTVSGLLAEAHDHAERVAPRALPQPTTSPPRGCPRSRCPPSRRHRGRAPGRRLADEPSRGGVMATPGRQSARPLDIDALLADPDVGIIVCCGSGGVGKTTTAAALGLRAAEAGRRVVVLTIDPARRLAQSLGLTELDNTSTPVDGVGTRPGGSLTR